jgi:hypothetical protein
VPRLRANKPKEASAITPGPSKTGKGRSGENERLILLISLESLQDHSAIADTPDFYTTRQFRQHPA